MDVDSMMRVADRRLPALLPASHAMCRWVPAHVLPVLTWAEERAGARGQSMARKNEAVAQLLEHIARLLTLKRDDPYRISAYIDAARTIGGLADDIEVLHQRGQLEEIRGVGPSIAEKVAEYLETGRSSYEQELEREIAPEAPELLEIPSIGPARARLIQERLGISTLPELARAARDHRLRTLPGIGETLERRIADEAAHARRQSEHGVAVPAT
jgi:DNA polymerase (family 10)